MDGPKSPSCTIERQARFKSHTITGAFHVNRDKTRRSVSLNTFTLTPTLQRFISS